MHERHIHMQQHVSHLTRKGQVTIPAEIRRLLGLAPHDKVAFLVHADKVQISPATSVVAQTAGMLRGDQPMLTPQQEKEPVEKAMAEEAEGRAG